MSESLLRKIQNQIEKHGNACELEELCLDGIEIVKISKDIKALLESCKNVEYLTMNDCSLQSLQNFPLLPELLVLELSQNRLWGNDFQPNLLQNHKISHLAIDQNRISNPEYLRCLKELTNLEQLEINDNIFIEVEEDYRDLLFTMLPAVKYIDCLDREGNRVQSDGLDEVSIEDFDCFDENYEDIANMSPVRKRTMTYSQAPTETAFKLFKKRSDSMSEESDSEQEFKEILKKYQKKQ